MGTQQAFQWAASHPDMVERIAPFCGTAKTTPHNAVFLEGVRAALTADAGWMAGDYADQPARGLRALARVYAGWGFSQPFYKRELYRQMGFSSLEDFLTGFWEKRYMHRDANNLLSMLRTWQLNDVGATPGFGGSAERALSAIKAKAAVMAGQTDLYFTPEANRGRRGTYSRLRFPRDSVGGVTWPGPASTADSQFIEDEIKALLCPDRVIIGAKSGAPDGKARGARISGCLSAEQRQPGCPARELCREPRSGSACVTRNRNLLRQ